MYYILDKMHQPVACDEQTWVRWFENIDNRRVALTEIKPGTSVSTVCLGLDHNYRSSGPPILFESMAFVHGETFDSLRYCTWAQALAGHRIMVKAVRARLHEIETLHSQGHCAPPKQESAT